MTHCVVQLSDCHLFADPSQQLRGITTWSRFKSVLQDVRRRIPQCEVIVITGDLAHDEQPATYASMRAELGDWLHRVRVIPGNHDDRQALCDAFPQALRQPPDRVTFHVLWEHWQLIGLDSQQTGELPGRLGGEQLGWLKTHLNARPDLSTVVFMHHPPVSVHSAWLDKIGLEDAEALERLLHDHPQVRLIGCGHVHQESAASLGPAAVFTVPAVGPQFRPRTQELEIDTAPPAYRVWSLARRGCWATQVFWCAARSTEER